MTGLGYFIVGGLLALNVRMTRRVSRAPDEYLTHKRLLIASIWLMPFLGALTARNHIRFHVPGEAFRGKVRQMAEHVVRDVAPAQLSISGAPPVDITGNLQIRHGFPMLDWEVMKHWCASIGDPDFRRQARNASRRAWLLHVRDALGPQFTLHETKDAWVLSSLEPNVVAAAADFMLTTRGRITRLLRRLAGPLEEAGILMVFGDEESYYRYIAAYDSSEGESAMSSGMFIDAGCPHFVTVRADLTLIEPIIVHELTHSALSHLAIPTWLNEGIAVNTEHQLTGAPRYARISPAMHQAFWNENEIQEFWSGELFRRPDDGAALSYDLARIMVENMAQQWGAFEAFVFHASRDDAGAQAARDHLGIDQGAYVCALLGLEPSMAWSPRTFSVV